MHDSTSQRTALITGASKGLGRALAGALATRGWRLVVDARDPGSLAAELTDAVVIPGDVTDPRHRDALATAVDALGRLDLLVNNASDLGPSPLPTLARLPLESLRRIYETDVVAPLALVQALAAQLRDAGGTIINVSSDAAVEPYPGWGGYGSAKAALDQLSAVLAAEEPDLRVYAVDPGDMRTDMHQAAFPGQDITDRPEPATVVPALLRLLDARPASGRYRVVDWAARCGGGPVITTFELPAGLMAAAPPPARDGVRLLVAHPDGIDHARFSALGSFLSPGDLVVVNTSGTLAGSGRRHPTAGRSDRHRPLRLGTRRRHLGGRGASCARRDRSGAGLADR